MDKSIGSLAAPLEELRDEIQVLLVWSGGIPRIPAHVRLAGCSGTACRHLGGSEEGTGQNLSEFPILMSN